jgi:hypothetical protein
LYWSTIRKSGYRFSDKIVLESKDVTSGEIGFSAGAEGATAPETLRQTDRVMK